MKANVFERAASANCQLLPLFPYLKHEFDASPPSASVADASAVTEFITIRNTEVAGKLLNEQPTCPKCGTVMPVFPVDFWSSRYVKQIGTANAAWAQLQQHVAELRPDLLR